MATRYNHSFRSRVNNARGHSFEEMILQGCEYYRRKGLAEISKTPEPFRVIQKLGDGEFKVRSAGKAQPDFQGTLLGGQAIVFEAKYSLSKERRINKSVLSAAQESYLRSHYEKGALTGVCVGVHNTYAFIQWNIWEEMKSRYGRKYMTEKDLGPFKVLTPGMIRFLDYENGDGENG
ncbi:Holliday junction resolvase RecU [Vagococcus sp. BWB3-3]|uniref:Holliday junction resolvase RecU n=1 Tax=Vagococcus allomyrinae TaxID=2794353 RepID=A0A940P9G7_9ENTE|nr:Holliday junction resolvase RecU [Vagococcus allomyrinae]MBP1040397.1 Holliday junction resolvase RecU [Vagococcus allomyrinae]